MGILYSHLKGFFFLLSGLARLHDWCISRMLHSSTVLYILLMLFISLSPVIVHLFSRRQEHDKRGEKMSKGDSAKLGIRMLSFFPLNYILKKKHRKISIPIQMQSFIILGARGVSMVWQKGKNVKMAAVKM